MDLALLLGLLIGLISVALAIFFGLSGFRNRVSDKLSSIEKHTQPIGELKDKAGKIEERVITIQGTAEKAWDLLSMTLAKGGTVERNLENLVQVKITAEPGEKETLYLIEIEKPILLGGWIDKLSKETELSAKEVAMFGREPGLLVPSRTRLRMVVPSTDPISCTEYIALFLKWLDSTYFESLKSIKGFEEPILT